MRLPDELQWQRVEQLAERAVLLPGEGFRTHISELAAAGESATVLILLGNWLSLPPLPSSLNSGDLISGRYTLKEKLGEGSMGSVWRAGQKLIGRDVALKIIHPPLVTPDLSKRFLGEMEILGKLDHTGIVKIFDAGFHEQDGLPPSPFFAMELVEGFSLNQWAALHRHEQSLLLRVAARFCEALQSAHDRKIVHRDLKPANILVRKDNSPVVLDFGIARLAGIAFGEESGLFSGTPQYAAPEQHLGRDHDFRSGESVDVYASGAILFEMLTGRRLFEFSKEATLSEMRRIILHDPPSRLSAAIKNCPQILDELLARSVRKSPADRFYSMAALGRAIGRTAAMLGAGPVVEPWLPGAGVNIPGTKWKLLRKIGEGSAGEVWLGEHLVLGEKKVFKFCETEEKARTLKRELSLFRLLKERVGQNPHFIQLHEVSLDEAPWYLMMDYVQAENLEQWHAEQKKTEELVPEALKIEIIIQTAEALQTAHEAGILHRDIKPSNLLVRLDDGNVHIYISDFGIGQIVADELSGAGTRLGFTHTVADLNRHSLSGTMLYLAPELLEGNPATSRSDIYSLGVLFWQLLIGNLRTALDPLDWDGAVSDPLLKNDLSRCLAGSPEKRWASAGELAASLRALPARRESEQRKQIELVRREKAAYRRGVLRTSAMAAIGLAVVGWLAWVGWAQRREAQTARGEIALKQAAAVAQIDFTIGRRERAFRLLEMAASTVKDDVSLRNASAVVFGISDLIEIPSLNLQPSEITKIEMPVLRDETCRELAKGASLLAVARDVDGVSGVVELYNARTGDLRSKIERKNFPWIPVPESGMLKFSPDGSLLAVGGAATSRHVLLFDTANGTLDSYIFQGADPFSCAWDSTGHLLATGGADGLVRVWDIRSKISLPQKDVSSRSFDLPPKLDVPAIDQPLQVLTGHRGPVKHLSFSSTGWWIASIDNLGYLRIHSRFPSASWGGEKNRSNLKNAKEFDFSFAVETRLEEPGMITSLEGFPDRITVQRSGGGNQSFRIDGGNFPDQFQFDSEIVGLAWNGEGTKLGARSLTDLYWMEVLPLQVFHQAFGKNPSGILWQNGSEYWATPAAGEFAETKLVQKNGVWTEESGSKFPLREAAQGQGSVTAAVSARDGRIAIYRGRRIQFFFNHQAGGSDSSVLAKGGSGEFRSLIWDQPGQLLGAVFQLAEGRLRLESWKTSAHFPPSAVALPPVELEGERMTSANDGKTFLVRGVRGIQRIDPAAQIQVSVDASASASQNGPLSVTLDGKKLVYVCDRNMLRILKLPENSLFAEIRSPRNAAITHLEWDGSGNRFASLIDDGTVQVWNLKPWREWLAAHQLE